MSTYDTTIHVRDTCLCLHVQRAARALARRFDAVLRPLELTHGQFSLINAINRPQPAPMAPIAKLLGMDRTTLTAMLKPLERRGLVTLTVDSDDARNRLLALTAAGRRQLARAVPLWRREHARLDRQLAAPAQLRKSLAAVS